MWGFLKPNFKPHEYWLSRTRCCNSTYRLRYWNSTNLLPKSFNTIVATAPTVYGIETQQSLLEPLELRVATAPTVYGIETLLVNKYNTTILLRCNSTYRLRYWNVIPIIISNLLLLSCNSTYRLRYWNNSSTIFTLISLPFFVATAPTVYGIETTCQSLLTERLSYNFVATAPTVYGIETVNKFPA